MRGRARSGSSQSPTRVRPSREPKPPRERDSALGLEASALPESDTRREELTPAQVADLAELVVRRLVAAAVVGDFLADRGAERAEEETAPARAFVEVICDRECTIVRSRNDRGDASPIRLRDITPRRNASENQRERDQVSARDIVDGLRRDL